ncbi:MAG: SLC13 family permease [Phormidium sp.]|nr:MAG: Citrate transporter [Phormidium sp. OSCR]
MDIILTLVILVLALIGFVSEFLPPDIIALSVTVLLMVCGLVTPEEGISGFSNSATVTVMAMFILSAGIAKTGVIQIIRDFLIRWGGQTSNQQIFTLGIIVGPISGFINNTAVIAIFLPIVEDWCRKQKRSPSKLLIPLSYISILGGMTTLVGTSTNILASGLSDQLGYGPFTIFEFSKAGIFIFLFGLLYLTLFAASLLPTRKTENESFTQGYGLRDYVSELVITPQSSLVGETLSHSGIQRKFDLDVLELLRDKVRFAQPLADKILQAGDVLVVRSSREDLLKIREERGLELFADVKFSQTSLESVLSSEEDKIGEVLILSNSRLIGTTLKEIRFRQRYNATVLAVRRGSELVKGPLGRVPLRFGDLLLLQGPKQSFIGLQTTRELLVLEQRDVEMLRQDKAGISVLIGLTVIGLSAFGIMPILVSAWAGVIALILTKCLRPGEIYGAIRWDIIFLLAGLIPLGIAMRNSGTTAWIAEHLVAIGGHLPGYWVLVFFFIITSAFTEVISNNAAVVLMLPIAVEVAQSLGLNPFAAMFAVTFAASNSYLSPIGYQTNTMVYGPGGYKFTDFARVGAPLTLTLMFLVPWLITIFYGL